MRRPKRSLRYIELAALLLILVVSALVFLPSLSGARESARRASCQNNLKQLGLVMKMFANESKGERFPPLSPVYGNWMMDPNAVWPEYVTDLNIFVCPSSPLSEERTFTLRATAEHPGAAEGARHADCVSSLFYIYTGYGLWSDEQAQVLFEAYLADPSRLIAQESLELAVPVWDNSDRVTLPGSAGVPVLWDRVFPDARFLSHEPAGGNVLHLDGHVQFVRYGYYNNSNFFPMTRLAVETFGAMLPRLSGDCYGL